jgi:hypothetical protein
MELHQLQAFVVAQELSFSHAARLLHIAQPALSRKIKALEDEFGVALLTRSANAVALTECAFPAGSCGGSFYNCRGSVYDRMDYHAERSGG